MNEARYRRLVSVLDRRQPDLTVLMDQVHKAHNFSAIVRSCDATGVFEAHAVPTERGMPVHAGTASGAQKWVKVHAHETIEAAAAHLHERGFRLLAAHPGEGAVDYRSVDYTHATAFVMGAELEGLSEAALTLADGRVAIPMEGMVASLNVSVATALLLFEAAGQRRRAGLYDRSRIEPDVRARLLFEWSYPRIAERLRARGLAYPALSEDGSIADPSALDPLRGL